MIKLSHLQQKDYDKAIQFAIEGMHFDQYITNEFIRYMYGKHFLYMELERASHVLAAYEGDELRGLLIAELEGQPKLCQSFWRNLYVKSFDFLIKIFAQEAAGAYDHINQAMLTDYKRSHQPDGEIVFLAADSQSKTRGIGSQLLAAFEKEVAGKEIYLFTDSNCTYQFYEKRGFERICQKEANLEMGNRVVSLDCFLYRKQID